MHTYEDQNINRGLMTAVLMVGSFISILNLTLLTTAIPTIMEALQISPNQAQWLNTAFILVIGIIIPITAYLIKTYTIRTLFFTAMGAFTLGTVLASVAFNFELILMGRIIQAIGAGIMFPLVQTVVVLIFPIEKRGTIMGVGGLVASFAPAIGPTLSGWIIELISWRAVFFAVLPIAAVDLIVAYFVLKNVTELKPSKVDLLSMLLSTVGFGGLLFGFSLIGGEDVSAYIAGGSIILGAFSLLWFIMRQLNLKKPILEFRVFKNRVFSLATVVAIISFSAMISAETILPIYMHRVLGFTAFEAGLALLPGSIVFGAVTLVSGMIYDRVGVRWLAVLGLAIVMASTFLFTRLTESTPFSYILVVQTIRMLGIAMLNTPIKTASLNQLPDSLIPDGTTMMSALRQISAGIATAVFITIMTLNSEEGLAHGVNVSFMVAAFVALFGAILSFFIKEKRVQETSEMSVQS